jgi:hypothetical protein
MSEPSGAVSCGRRIPGAGHREVQDNWRQPGEAYVTCRRLA